MFFSLVFLFTISDAHLTPSTVTWQRLPLTAMALSSADASLDGMLLDPVSGDWYDPQAGSALIQAVVLDVPMNAASGSSFTPVVTRPLRNTPYDRANGRDESERIYCDAGRTEQSFVAYGFW